MRKLLSLSLGLLTAASSFAAVKTVTIPAVPDGKRSCSFVVNEIPDSLGLTDLEYEVLNRDLKGTIIDNPPVVMFPQNGIKDQIEEQPKIKIVVTDSLNTVNDTIICNIFRGKSPRVSISDTTICAQAKSRAIYLTTYEYGTYWGRNKFTNEMGELPSFSDLYYISKVSYPHPDSIIWLKDYIAPNDSDVAAQNIIFDNPSKSGTYLFTMLDTITGCQAGKIANITVKDCEQIPVNWVNYNGPKEYHAYTSDDCLSYLREDSIMAFDPMVNCICPISLDTIVESTQSGDSKSCEFFIYDVTVKLAARNYADTITAYTVHVSYPALPFDMPEGFVPNNMGNCIFTVPEFIIPEPDCICPSFYYLSDMTPNAGDTITKDTPIIFTFTSSCGDTIVTQTNILLPKLSVNVVGDTVYAQDLLPIHSKEIVDITAERWMYNKFTQTYEYGPVPCILDVYRDSIISENKVFGYGIPELYKLDNGNKSADYYYVVTDTVSGCKDSAFVNITVLSIDTTAAPVIPTGISEVKGDVYTITGILVKKDVYLKEVMNDLKDGLYIFNKQKILIRRKE